MNGKLEIKPLVGFGPLKFGAGKDEVKRILGAPEESEILEIEGEVHDVEVWSYWEQGHSVYFEKEHDERCTNFETDHEEALLFGEKIMGMGQEPAIALMKKHGYADHEIEEEDPGEVVVFFHDAHMQFVFEDGLLALVSWAVAMDEEEVIRWP